MKIAAIVVLYNPNNEVQNNIGTYYNNVDKVFVVDNSVRNHALLFEGMPKCQYIPLWSNQGIAKALNVGCREAIRQGFEIIITFDQDTVASDGLISSLLSVFIDDLDDTIVAPNVKHIYRDSKGDRIFSEEIVFAQDEMKPIWVITSGTMFSSDTFEKVGGFDEKLFISQVDQDFCFRVTINGLNIRRVSDCYIYQEAGHTEKKKIGNRIIHVPNLNYKRYYYIFRNELYLRKKWGGTTNRIVSRCLSI